MESGELTKGHVLDYIKEHDKPSCALWLRSAYIDKYESESCATLSGYMDSVKTLFGEYQKVNKNKSRNGNALEVFRSSSYQFPERKQSSKKRKQADDVMDAEAGETVASVLHTSLEEKEHELDDTNKSLAEKDLELDAAQRKIIHLTSLLTAKNEELKRIRNMRDYYMEKADKVGNKFQQANTRFEEGDVELSTALDAMNEMKKGQLEASERIKTLEDRIKILQNKTVITFSGNHYTTDFTCLVHKLLEHHVGYKHIEPVIKDCLEFVGKVPSKLPSTATIGNMNVQRLALAQKQLGEEFAQQENTCLYSDETSKYSEKYMGYHATDADGRYWVLGIRDLATKSSDDTLSTFKEVLQDIDDRTESTESQPGKRILGHIRSIMSDRASTEKKWHQLLESFRSSILPEVVENWDELTEEDRAPIESLTNFFCGLHSFVQLAEVTASSLHEVEKSSQSSEQISTPPFVLNQANEASTVRLIRTASKAFARTGDQKSGCYGDFKLYVKPYLEENGMRSVPLCPFRGNRFNILFFNGAHVYFLHEHMKEYLDKQHNLNGLLKAVKYDLGNPMNIAGCKAVGLLNKFVTRPLWKVIEDKEVHIMQMSNFIQALLTLLCNAQEHLEEFMTGQMQPFKDETCIKKDAVYDCLIKPSKYDDDVQVFLSIILPAMTTLLKEHYKEHLPGGQHFNPSPQAYDVAKSVDKHNKFAERVLAYIDHLLRARPSSNHLSQEAVVMFCLNKTGNWLDQKSAEERHQIVSAARKDARTIQKQYQQRRQAIVEKRKRLLQEKLQKEEARKQKQVHERELMTADIVYYGLWQSSDQVEASLLSIRSKTEKIDALKAQLRFRQHILQQDADPKLYRFSEAICDQGGANRRRGFGAEELAENLRVLISKASQYEAGSSKEAPFLVGKRVSHVFQTEGERRPCEGKVISTVPGYPEWYNIKYTDDPAIYSYQLLQDMEKGDLEIII